MKKGNSIKNGPAPFYRYLFQIFSLLTVPYLFCSFDGVNSILLTDNPLGFLFCLGCSVLPRAEMVVVSKFYLVTGIELTVFYSILIIALVWGLVLHRAERARGRSAIIFWCVTAALIAADLVLRALPLYFNRVYGLWVDIPAALIRAAMLIFVILHVCRLVRENRSEDVTEG